MSSIYDNYPAVRYVDESEKATDEQCRRCKGNCRFIGLEGEWACYGFIPITNADRIRSMSDKELAKFLYHRQFHDERFGYDTEGDILDWLKWEETADEL